MIKNILDQKNLKSYYYVKMWIIIVHDFIFCAFQVIQRKAMKKVVIMFYKCVLLLYIYSLDSFKLVPLVLMQYIKTIVI
jgi:hypothetical protein